MFNPRNHPADVVTAFTHFTRKYGYAYDGENRTVPSTANTVALIAEWKDQDKARLFLSRAVSDEFLDDFESTVAEDEQTNIKFTTVDKMETQYTPNSNKVRNHYIFHRMTRNSSEKFDDFVHRIKADAEPCDFQCESDACNVHQTLIRDQIIFGTSSETIREDALKNQWNLTDLIKNGQMSESGVIAASQIKTEAKCDINRTKYGGLSGAVRKEKPKHKQFTCWKCKDDNCTGYNKCKFHHKQCTVCKKYGHAKNSRLCKGASSKRNKRSPRKNKTNRIEVISSEGESTDNDSDTSSSDYEKVVQPIYQKK